MYSTIQSDNWIRREPIIPGVRFALAYHFSELPAEVARLMQGTFLSFQSTTQNALGIVQLLLRP
jgi:hypothetical protein